MGMFAPPPPAAISRVLATFDREQLAGFVAVAIDLMDLADGDPDIEDDDPQGEVTDDDPAFTERDLAIANLSGNGPGCSISDPDYGIDDVPHDDRGDYRL